jgi:hypothetical protein
MEKKEKRNLQGHKLNQCRRFLKYNRRTKTTSLALNSTLRAAHRLVDTSSNSYYSDLFHLKWPEFDKDIFGRQETSNHLPKFSQCHHLVKVRLQVSLKQIWL